jgi:hypothetical protein
MTRVLLFFSLSVLVAIYPAFANEKEETLEAYWPMHGPERNWNVIEISDKDSLEPKKRLSVTNKPVGENQIELWFSNKPGQADGSSDVELYEYCRNPGGRPWLFLNSYINAVQGTLARFHPVQSTRILFTPDHRQAEDLVADGTYDRCGNKGQPYLLWNQNIQSYRIQVWGFLTENPKWKWYWDATINKPAPVTNECIKPAQTVKAIKVQEAWWNNFKATEGTWNLGNGDIARDGLPMGTNVRYGRTVWHAEGQQPYYLIGPPNGNWANQCSTKVMQATESGQ